MRIQDGEYNRLLSAHGSELAAATVLEIGGGGAGIARHLRQPVTALEAAGMRPAVSNLQIVAGHATSIPFPDGAFDCVVSNGALARLPAVERGLAIAEMIRVSGKKCFLIEPHGSVAQTMDRELAGTLSRMGVAQPQWLMDHVAHGLPMLAETVGAILQAGFIPSIRTNQGMTERYASVSLEPCLPQLRQFQMLARAKEPVASCAGAGADMPYSVLVEVDRQRPLGSGADPFDDVAACAPGGEGNLTLFSVHHKDTGLLGQFKLIKAFDVTGRLPGFETGLHDPLGLFERNNPRCSEMSAIHYVWRNGLAGDTVGFCHYRRFLHLFPEEVGAPVVKVSAAAFPAMLPRIEDAARIGVLLDRHDLLLACPVGLHAKSQDEQYAMAHYADDYYAMLECLIGKYPFLRDAMLESIASTKLYATNLFICGKALFDAICRVWFDVLGCCEARIDPAGRYPYQARDIGFLSERVFDVIVRHLKRTGRRVAELPGVFVES